AAELEKNIADSHGEPTFYPMQPTTQSAPETTEDVPERFRLAENTPTGAATEKTVAVPVPVKPVVEKPTEKMPVKVAEKVAVASTVKAQPVAAAKPIAKPAVQYEPKPAATTDAKPDSQGLPGAWVVQVASVSSKASADDLVSRLRKRGFRASAAQQGSVFKVSVGPELDRGIAESLKQRLSADAELKLNGFIVPYRP
ncbi:MAG: SPOR domain-containing protein, partial [Paraperlucidibaca sp.]